MLAICAVLVAGASASASVFTVIDDPSGPTTPIGINAPGDIVGHYSDSSGCLHGFVRHGSTYSPLAGTPPAGTTTLSARGITDLGVIVGFYSTAPVSDTCQTTGGPPPCIGCHGFILQGSSYTPLNAQLPGVTIVATRANGVNLQGAVVGRADESPYTDSKGTHHPQHGFLWQNNVYTPIKFPGPKQTIASGINILGEIVGYYSTQDTDPSCNPCRPFTRSPQGTYMDIGHRVSVAGTSPRILARGINLEGAIAGAFDDSQGNAVPFLLSRGTSSVLSAVPGTDRDAFGINARGEIVGDYHDPNTHGFLLTDEHRGDDRH
jgi:uncharacterized membrane protein